LAARPDLQLHAGRLEHEVLRFHRGIDAAIGGTVPAGDEPPRTSVCLPPHCRGVPTMTLCPIAIVAGCKKCPAYSVCPLKSVIGDEPKPPEAKAPEAKKK
jgi:hypothetical protein